MRGGRTNGGVLQEVLPHDFDLHRWKPFPEEVLGLGKVHCLKTKRVVSVR